MSFGIYPPLNANALDVEVGNTIDFLGSGTIAGSDTVFHPAETVPLNWIIKVVSLWSLFDGFDASEILTRAWVVGRFGTTHK